MRTHFLKALPIEGRSAVLEVFPEFDLYNLGRVSCLAIKAGQEPTLADLSLTADYRDLTTGAVAEVTLDFSGIRYAKLPELTPVFYFSELEIEDVRSDHLEGIRYRAKDHGSAEFEVLAKEITILLAR